MFVTSALHVLVAAAAFVMLLCCGVLGSSLDADVSDDVASLLNRMKTQESLNQELATKLLRHEDKLSLQDTLTEELKKELKKELLLQTNRLSQQGNLNKELNKELKKELLFQTNRLSQQEYLNKELTTRLARQDGTLLQQGRLIRQLKSVVAASRESSTVSRASATVSRASASVSRASANVSRTSAPASRASVPVSRASVPVSRASALEDTVPTSRHVSIVDVMDGPDPETPDSRADSAVSGRIVVKQSNSGHNDVKLTAAGQIAAKQSDSGPNIVKPSAAGHNVAKQSASGHNVVKRSDDGGPLEAVVNQISQRVTEMGAELQALKAQTTSDLNALSIKTASDLQALKTQTTTDVQTLQISDRQQDKNIHDARTSTFVRWGSSTCGNSSSLVYSGIVGGSWYDDTGAAADYLCLTLSPVPSQHSPPLSYAKLYGGEYQTQDSHQDKDPLCAVCRAAFSTTVMVPGTDTCSPGWHRHYSGFLMAGHYGNNAGSQYICVDPALESAPHGDANENGKLLYYTVTACGSLPCGPYVNNKVVTCAVCSM